MGNLRRRWFMRFLGRALRQRKGRVAVAVLSVTIAVAIMVSAAGISLGIRKKLGGELKAYGANVMVSVPGGLMDIDDRLISALSPENGVEHYTLQLYASAELSAPGGETDSARVELMGMELEKAAGLRVDGSMPAADNEALLGASLREAMALKPGQSIRADFGTGPVLLRVTGFVETGGPEDKAIIMGLKRSGELAGLSGKASAALVRADTAMMEASVNSISAALEGVEVKTLTQVARAEQGFLSKIELLMALVAVVVLVASSISVSSTMSATVLERLKEIGLMKAIGGTRAEIGAFFMAEGFLIGLGGGLMGYTIGALAAQAVSKGAFGSFIPVPLYLLLAGVLAGAIISVSASLWPLWAALRYKPSVILRGE